MTMSKLAILSTAAVLALGLAAGPASAAVQPYTPSGTGNALGTGVEEGAIDPAEAAQPSKGSGMAKALGSDVEGGGDRP